MPLFPLNRPRRLHLSLYGLAVLGLTIVVPGAVGAKSAESVGLAEQPPALGQLSMQTTRVVVFKDGHALFLKKARGVADAEGRVFTDEVPDNAVLGSFWATSKREIQSMSAEWGVEVALDQTADPAVTLLELLRANSGREVTLILADGEEVLGTLLRVLDRPPDTLPKAWTPNGSRESAATGEREEVVAEGGRFVLFESQRGTTSVVPLEDIRSLRSTELATTVQRQFQTVSREKRLSFELGSGAAGKSVEIDLFYFREGMSWIPTYRAQLDEGRASLSLQAELVNEAEDFDGAEVDFVVGVPNFRFRDVVSPLALERTIRHSLQAAMPAMSFNAISNANFAYQPTDFEAAADPAADPSWRIPQGLGDSFQDLFVYAAGKLRLRKGARAAVPVWTMPVPTRDVFTATLAPGAGSRPGEMKRNEVWHELDVENPSEMPWTTGPFLFMEGELPIAQDLLGYTPGGSSTRVRMAKAIEVRAETMTRELGRSDETQTFNRQDYTLVTREFSIRVTNFRDADSAIDFDTPLEGKVVSVPEGTAEETGRSGLNPKSEVRWKAELAPGETRTFVVTYEVFVR